jgi:hypothetical protein
MSTDETTQEKIDEAKRARNRRKATRKRIQAAMKAWNKKAAHKPNEKQEHNRLVRIRRQQNKVLQN